MVSSGIRNLAKLIGGWAFAFGLVAVGIVYFDEVRTALGLKLNPEDFGVVAEERPEPEVRTVIKYVEREPTQEQGKGPPRRNLQARKADQETFSASATLPRGSDGHFRGKAVIGGRAIPVLVDTGATLVALTYEDALAAGIAAGSLHFGDLSYTANGPAYFARVNISEMRLGGITLRDVKASVGQPGLLRETLLGMSFLGQLRMEMKGGLLVLEQ